MINQYKQSNNVYVVGYTNAGKSTLINKLLYNYSDSNIEITTSFLPSTTLDMIEIELDETLTLIDTPGLLEEGNILNLVLGQELKHIVPNKEIKPITYQIKGKQYIVIDKYAYVECLDATNVTLFFSSNLKIERIFTPRKTSGFSKKDLFIKAGEDVLISGLGFIKVSKTCHMNIFTYEGVDILIRDSLI